MRKPTNLGELNRARLRLKNSRHTSSAVDQAIAESWSLRHHDPQEALGWADLAVEIASGCSAEVQARAHANRANALRQGGRYADAAQALDLADSLSGRPDPLRMEFRASLMENLCDFDGARTALDEAAQLRLALGDHDGFAKVLVLTGKLLMTVGRIAEAVVVYQSAVDCVVSDRELLRAALHGLAHAVARTRRPHKALKILQAARELFIDPEPLIELQLTWLMGRVAISAGEDLTAVECLTAARDGFYLAGQFHDSALAALDLGSWHIHEGRYEQATIILEPVAEMLAALGVDLEADLALVVRLLAQKQTQEAQRRLAQAIARAELH